MAKLESIARNLRKKKQKEHDLEGVLLIQRMSDAKRRNRLFDSGLCTKCGKNKIEGDNKSCEACNVKKAAAVRKVYLYRTENNLCILCGKQKSVHKAKLCIVCYLKRISSRYFGSTHHVNDLIELLNKQNGLCPYTGIKLTIGENASLDHIIAKALGGANTIDNLQWVYFGDDFDINMMKRDIPHENFIKAIKTVYEHINKNT